MVTTILISFTVVYKGRSGAEISKFYRDLYGYVSYSYYGRYVSRKEGFLDRMKYIRYSMGLFMIRKDDDKKVLTFLKRKDARVLEWEVVPKREETERLGLQTT